MSDDWVPFSQRYGLSDDETLPAETRRHNPRFVYIRRRDAGPACRCAGASSRQCNQTMTAEDLFCDACREWCWARDNHGRMHRLLLKAVDAS